MSDSLSDIQPPQQTRRAGALTRRSLSGGRRGERDLGRLAWPLGFLLLALLLPFIQRVLPNHDYWLDMRTVIVAMDYVLLALGLNVVVGYAGLLDLGYVAFYAIGAYVFAWLASSFFQQRNVHLLDIMPGGFRGIHLSFWLVVIIGGVITALFGVIIGAPTLRLRGDYLAIVTLGFGEIIPQVVLNADNVGGVNVTNGAKGINPLDTFGFGKTLHEATGGLLPERILIFDYTARYYVIAAFCIIAVFVSLRLREGKLGRAWIAIREDELAASAMGIPLMRTKLWAYAIGAFFGGVGGVFYAANQSAVFPANFFFNISVLILCMVILGGMGNVYGVIIGAFVLSWLNNRGLQVVGDSVNSATGLDVRWPDKNFLIFGIILVVMMLLRPEGLLPSARQRLLIHEQADEQSSTLAPGHV